VSIPGEIVELLQEPVEVCEPLQERGVGRKAELAVAMRLAERRDHVIAPHLLQPLMRHQPAEVVGLDPAFSIEGEPAFGDQHVQVRVPLEVGSKGVDHRDQPDPHVVLLPRPLVERGARGAGEDGECDVPVEEHEGAQLPRRRKHEVVVGYIQQVVEYRIGPAIRGMLAAGRAEAGFAGMRDHLDLLARGTLIHVTAERRRTAGPDLSDGLEHHGPDPASLRLEERLPVPVEDRSDAVADLGAYPEHQGIRAARRRSPGSRCSGKGRDSGVWWNGGAQRRVSARRGELCERRTTRCTPRFAREAR
jgi:hypothetical protein